MWVWSTVGTQTMKLLGQGEASAQNSPTSLDVKLPKGSPEKLVLAWWLRENTTVTMRWLSERLGMGRYTRVAIHVKLPSSSISFGSSCMAFSISSKDRCHASA